MDSFEPGETIEISDDGHTWLPRVLVRREGSAIVVVNDDFGLPIMNAGIRKPDNRLTIRHTRAMARKRKAA